MDNKKICQYVRTAVFITVLLVISPSSIYADGSVTVVTAMPVPVPILPAVVPEITANDLPSIDIDALPSLDTSALTEEWSAVTDFIESSRSTVNVLLDGMEEQTSNYIADSATAIGKTRGVINGVRARVGSPLSDVYVRNGETTYTAYKIALDMVNSIQFSVAYLRGVSNLGGVGLDLTFILLGLGWMAFVNIVDLLIRIGISIVKGLASAVEAFIAFSHSVYDLANLIASIIDIITGPLT